MSRLKKIAKVTAGVIGAAYLVTAPFSMYIVHKTQYGVERRFGAVVHEESKPGPHFKSTKAYVLPIFQIFTKVERYDKRLLEYKDSKEDIITKDHKFIDSNRFLKWRIINVKKFVRAVGSKKIAQSLLDDVVFNNVWDKMANHTFEENQVTKRKEIRERMVKEGNVVMKSVYGIEAVDLRIKRLNFPEESRPKIHERMIAEQKKRATKIKAGGEREQRRILGEKERIVKRLISEGRNEVETILGKAEREVAGIYQDAYDKDLEFYMFWEKLQTFKELADSKPTLFLSTNNQLLEDLLNSSPEKE